MIQVVNEAAMSSLPRLRELISERLTAAAEEIFRHVERIVVEYEEEVDRQRRLLELVSQPRLKLQRIDLPQQNVCKEEVLTEQQLCDQERNSSLDQEEPESLIKEDQGETCTSQEADTSMLTPDNEQSDHLEPEPDSDHQLLPAVSESQDQTGHQHVEMIMVESMKEKHQHRLMKVLRKPQVKLQRIALPQYHVCKEEEVLTEQQLRDQERNSSLDQEEPESLQIKQEEEEICTSKEAGASMLTPNDEQSDHMEPEPDGDHQLLPPVAEGQELPLNEEVLTEQQLCDQERNPSLDQEEPESLQIKQEEEEICISKEAGALMLTPDDEQSDHMEPEPDSDHQLLPPVAEGQGQTVHMRNTTVEKPLMCNICKKRFAYKRNLMKHMRTHNAEMPYSCETCGSCFQTLLHLLEHKKMHTCEKPHMCNICKKCFAYKCNLKQHKTTHTGEKPFSCETCGKCFRQHSHLKVHKMIHTGEKPHMCNVCKKCFGHRHDLNVHLRTHTGEKPYMCNICKKCFRQRQILIKHIRTHTREKPHMCNICKKCFGQRPDLIRHSRTHTGEKPHVCNICKKCFGQRQVLIKHIKTHTGEKPYTSAAPAENHLVSCQILRKK